jgi:uncharacterized membrane protein YdbT with pleckstrin-like domain
VAYLDDLIASDESIVLIAHRHVLFLVLHTALFVFGTIALWIVAIIAYQQLPDTANTIVSGLILLASLVPAVIAVYRFLQWKLEQYVVTDYRIIQVEGILNKRTFDSSLEKVNDVLMTQGLGGRIFGYGNINVLTGSEIGVNELTGIADPFAFKKALLDAKMRLDGFERPSRQPQPVAAQAPAGMTTHQNDSTRLLAALVDLRDSGVISQEEYEERKSQLLR